MNRVISTILVGICLALNGCMHTVISRGGDDLWSPGGGRYHVGISAHGASGRAYADFTDKRIYLSITSLDRRNQIIPLFSREIRLRAADLSWRVHWQGSRVVRVTFTDDQPARNNSKRVVATYSFAYDPATNTFQEVRLL